METKKEENNSRETIRWPEGKQREREESVGDERDGELDWLGVFAELGCWRRGWRGRLVFASCLALLTPPGSRFSFPRWLFVAHRPWALLPFIFAISGFV